MNLRVVVEVDETFQLLQNPLEFERIKKRRNVLALCGHAQRLVYQTEVYNCKARSRCRDRLTIITYGNQKEITGAVIG